MPTDDDDEDAFDPVLEARNNKMMDQITIKIARLKHYLDAFTEADTLNRYGVAGRARDQYAEALKGYEIIVADR